MTSNVPKTLAELEVCLQSLSHDDHALKTIQSFAKNLGKTKDRQSVFNKKGAIVREPIIYQEVLNRGLITSDQDHFILLQGDIVSTESAYFLGERLTGMQKFAVATSTCDLILGRRQYASLLRIIPMKADDPKVGQTLGDLLKFTSTQRMYLPPLPDEQSSIVGNALVFDGIVQIKIEDLLMATRIASLSLVGWRIFGSIVRTIMVRAGESEIKMRSSMEN